MYMRQRMKCNKKIDYIQDICNGVENGGKITMGHEN